MAIGSFSGLASGIQWQDMIDQIMRLETARSVSPVQTRVAQQNSRQLAWNSFNGLVKKFSDAAKQLQDGTAFSASTVSASKTSSGLDVVSATASSSATPGNYRVEVIQLAQAEKLNGAAYASSSEKLSLSGEFFVGGKRVELAATDTLASVRDKINALNSGSDPSGVTATILSTSATSHRLILTADHTGTRGIELVDGDSGILQSLGVVNGTSARNASPTDSSRTETQRLASKSTALSSMFGLTAPPAKTTIVIDGRKVEVDLENDTLISVMNRVNEAGGDASLVEETVGGKTRYRLSVEGEVSADATGSSPADSQRIVELLGFVRDGRTAEIAAGRDATVRIDGFKLTRRTNVVSDAIAGVTIDLLAANGSERTSTLTGASVSLLADPKTIDAGSYDLALTTSTASSRSVTTSSGSLSVASDPGIADGTYGVELTTNTVRTTSTSAGTLAVVAAPATAAAGTYAVNITQAATRSNVSGVANTTYSGSTGDSMTITDSVTGIASAYSLTSGQTLDSVVAGLNSMFAANGMRMTATNLRGALRLEHTDYGSSAGFTVTNNHNRVATSYGIGSTGGGSTYQNGLDVAGTIGGIAATGSGRTLTGSSGAVTGLQLSYSDWRTGSPVGSVTISDATSITGGTIGGQAATWDAGTSRLTVTGGGSLNALAVSYTGPATSGSVGDVVVATTSTTTIDGATIDGEAAEWDAATSTIRGAAGSRFEGLEIGYSGAAAAGSVGTLAVSGDIGVNLAVTRNVDSTVTAVQKMVGAYNEVASFVDGQSAAGAPLYANSSLRSMLSSLKNVLLADATGLSSSDTAFTRMGAAGITLSKTGRFDVDAAALRTALTTSPTDVKRLFSTSGFSASSELSYLGSTSSTGPGTYSVNVTRAASRATAAGSVLGPAFTYSASDGVSDTLTVTDSATGLSKDLVVEQGQSLATIVSGLNSLFAREGMLLTAASDGDALRLTSSDYGSAAGFTLAGAGATAGLGLAAGSTSGQDVEGTFQVGATVYAATGTGQVLKGATGTPASGLRVSYTGAGVGSVGDLTFVLGVAGTAARAADPIARAGDGSVALITDSISQSVETLTRRIDSIQARLELRREALVRQFTRMEEAIGRFQAQGSWLTGQINSLYSPRQER